jgi:STE24 endopeptidase
MRENPLPKDLCQPSDRPTEPPPGERPEAAGLSADQLAEAKRYGRQELVYALADKALDVAFLTVAALFLAQPLDAWLQTFAVLKNNWSLRLVALFVPIIMAHIAVSLPLACYADYVLEHRFGLSTQTFTGWLWRYAKRNLLAAAFGAAMFLGLYWLIWTTGPHWWWLGAGAFFLVSILLGQLTPVLILPLFYKIQKLDAPELCQRIARLAEGTGLSIEGVYRLDLSRETVKANAMLAGLGRTRRVLLGDTLLESFSPEEIEVVFAHEIGHHVFRHIRKMIVAAMFYSAAGFWICDRLLLAWVAPTQGKLNYAELPVATLPLLMLILTLFAMLLTPLQNAISRRYELQCDRYALQRTGRSDAYLSAFRKLAKLNKDDPNPHWLEVWLFHSHPPILQRLALAEPRENG